MDCDDDDDDYTASFTAALSSLPSSTAAARAATLNRLLDDLAASRLRDLEPNEGLVAALLALLPGCWEEDW